MSFQITVLKVLDGYPCGRASIDELRRAVAILMLSGTEWTDRTKLLAARVPDLNIFGQAWFCEPMQDGKLLTPVEHYFHRLKI